MKKLNPLYSALFVAPVILAGAAFFLATSLRSPEPLAFQKAHWGMSHKDVARVNDSPLEPSGAPERFYRADEKLRAEGRYLAFETTGTFLGREARITYAFIDDRLVAYYVFVEDTDGSKLDAELRARLEADFGPHGIAVDDGTPLKMIWSSKDYIVNYWVLLNELRLVPKYRAGYGARYLPLESAATAEKPSKK